METTQTAVEWLIEQMLNERLKFTYTDMGVFWEETDNIIEQAKAMQKEQIEEAYLNGCSRVTPYGYYNDSAKQYYKETYGS